MTDSPSAYVTSTSDALLPSIRLGDRELHHTLIKRLMVRILQLDQDLVRPWGESVNNERLAAGVGFNHPTPRKVTPAIPKAGTATPIRAMTQSMSLIPAARIGSRTCSSGS
jgi:hypothetical protein